MIANMLAALRMLVVLSVLTGVAYPLLVTGIAQLAFPWRANGSLLIEDRKVVGSELIGQPFSDPKYFWSRPSATAPQPYNAGASSGSNLGARNPALAEAVAARIKALRDADPRGDRARTGGSRHGLRQRPRSAHQRGSGRVSNPTGRRVPAASCPTIFARSSRGTSSRRRSGFSARRG